MEPFKAFQVNTLELYGFKCYKERTRFTLGPLTKIIGGNHRGKSTLAEAVAFAVTGLTLWGDHRIDKLYCDQATVRQLQIIMTFTDEKDQSHELIRSRVGDNMSVYLDKCQVTQAMLSNLFGEPELFLTMFNPYYFIEVLGAKEDRARKLLERYLRPPSKDEVLSAMGPMSALIAEMPLLSPDEELKKVRKEIREQEDNRTYFEGQIDLIALQAQEQKKDRTALASELTAVEAELEELSVKRISAVDFSSLEGAAAEINARYTQACGKEIPVPDTVHALDAVEEATALVSAVESAQFTFEEADKLSAVLAEVKELYVRHARERVDKNTLTAGAACPTCHRPITAQELPQLHKAADMVLAGIAQEGSAKKAEAFALQEKEMAARAAFEQQREDHLKGAKARLTAARKNLVGLNEAYKAKVKQHQAVLAELEQQLQAAKASLERGGLTDDEYSRLINLLAKKSSCEERQARLIVSGNKEDRRDDPQLGLNHAQEQITQKRKVEEAIQRYIAVKNGLLADQIHMNRVSVSLFDVLKNSGLAKDVFRFLYEGRSYVSISGSEKLLAGLEFSSLFSRLSGRAYPVFIDEAQSLEAIDNVAFWGQVLMAYMLPGQSVAVEAVYLQIPAAEETLTAA